MAKGAATHTASLMAQQSNLNRGKDDKAISADDFNPYVKKKPQPQAIDDIEMLKAHWLSLTD